MTTTDLKPGDFVKHDEKGVGVVAMSLSQELCVYYVQREGYMCITGDFTGWGRVETVRPGHVQIRVDDLDLSGWEGGHEWKYSEYDNTRVAIRVAKAIAAQRTESTPPADEQERVDDIADMLVSLWGSHSERDDDFAQWRLCARAAKAIQAQRDRGEAPQATFQSDSDKSDSGETLPTEITVRLACPECGEALPPRRIIAVRQGPGWLAAARGNDPDRHVCKPTIPDEPTEVGLKWTLDGLRCISVYNLDADTPKRIQWVCVDAIQYGPLDWIDFTSHVEGWSLSEAQG